MNDQTEYRRDNPVLQDDEISIGELIAKLWRKRGLIVFLPLICAGLTIAGVLATKASNGETLSYYVELTGIKDKQYPNGAAFSSQDLLNPAVIAKISEAFKLTADVAAKLPNHVRVDFGSPISIGITTEFKAALSANSKASPEELALINERYQAQFTAAAQRGLRIAVDYGAMGLGKAEGAQFAYKLPEIWNQVFATEFQIFLDSGILGTSTVSSNLGLTTTVGVAEADLALEVISLGTDRLRNDTRFRAIQVDGQTAADLAQKIVQFRRLYFDPIFASSFTEEGGLSGVYRRDLLLELTELAAAREELDSRITVIKDLQKGSSNAQAESQSFNSSGSQMQLESGALEQLVSLSRTASLSEYLQQSLDQRYEIVQEEAKIGTRLAKMGETSKDGSSIYKALDANFYGRAGEKMKAITWGYLDLLEAAQASALSETPALYQVMTPVQGQKLLERRDFLFIALALALGGIVAVISALLWPAKQQADA